MRMDESGGPMVFPHGVDASEVLPRLWLGHASAARSALALGVHVLCVRGTVGQPVEACGHTVLDGVEHIRFLTIEAPPEEIVATRSGLDQVADWLNREWLCAHHPVFIHCLFGVERAPLAVVWFLSRHFGLSLDEAYSWVRARRPVVQDRQRWLT